MNIFYYNVISNVMLKVYESKLSFINSSETCVDNGED